MIISAMEALEARPGNISGLYRAPEPTAPALAMRLFSHIGLTKTYVLPDPIFFREAFLAKYKPPAMPSKEWDTEYRQLKSIGSVDWIGRTSEVNRTASFWFGFPLKEPLCSNTRSGPPPPSPYSLPRLPFTIPSQSSPSCTSQSTMLP